MKTTLYIVRLVTCRIETVETDSEDETQFFIDILGYSTSKEDAIKKARETINEVIDQKMVTVRKFEDDLIKLNNL